MWTSKGWGWKPLDIDDIPISKHDNKIMCILFQLERITKVGGGLWKPNYKIVSFIILGCFCNLKTLNDFIDQPTMGISTKSED